MESLGQAHVAPAKNHLRAVVVELDRAGHGCAHVLEANAARRSNAGTNFGVRIPRVEDSQFLHVERGRLIESGEKRGKVETGRGHNSSTLCFLSVGVTPSNLLQVRRLKLPLSRVET